MGTRVGRLCNRDTLALELALFVHYIKALALALALRRTLIVFALFTTRDSQ